MTRNENNTENSDRRSSTLTSIDIKSERGSLPNIEPDKNEKHENKLNEVNHTSKDVTKTYRKRDHRKSQG